MDRISFAVRERLSADRLNVINQGVIALQGQILTAAEGVIWGDILISASALRDETAARALTYVEVTTLTRRSLDEVIEHYPSARALVRRSALLEAMRKATDLISRVMKAKKDKEQAASGDSTAMAAAMAARGIAKAMSGGGSEHSDEDDAATV